MTITVKWLLGQKNMEMKSLQFGKRIHNINWGVIEIRNSIIKLIKVISIIFLIVSITIIGVLFLVKLGYDQQVAVIKNVNSNDYKIFESEFNVTFPLDTRITRVVVQNGKDSWLRVDLLLPKEKVKEFDSSISFGYENKESSDNSIEFIKVAVGTGDATKFIYYKENGPNTMISLTKYNIKDNRIWEMGVKAGFHTYEEMYKEIS